MFKCSLSTANCFNKFCKYSVKFSMLTCMKILFTKLFTLYMTNILLQKDNTSKRISEKRNKKKKKKNIVLLTFFCNKYCVYSYCDSNISFHTLSLLYRSTYLLRSLFPFSSVTLILFSCWVQARTGARNIIWTHVAFDFLHLLQ